MRDHYDCCKECDYWEERIDIHINNQIKESKFAKKKSLSNTKIIIPTNIKPPSGINKTRRTGSGVIFVENKVSDLNKDDSVGTNSSQ